MRWGGTRYQTAHPNAGQYRDPEERELLVLYGLEDVPPEVAEVLESRAWMMPAQSAALA
jgi:hypothetical protein